MAAANHIAYCDKWGYHYEPVTKAFIIDRGPHWQKLPATLALFDKGYDYVFWIDGDAFFVNCSKSLKPFIDKLEMENSSWLFSGDTLVVNSAQMLWKNTAAARQILNGTDGLYSPNYNIPLFENGAFAAYLFGARRQDISEIRNAYRIADECYVRKNAQCRYLRDGSRQALHLVKEDLKRHISIVPQRAMNSYSGNYQPGDFIYLSAQGQVHHRLFRTLQHVAIIHS